MNNDYMYEYTPLWSENEMYGDRPKMSGAAKRRLNWWLARGKTYGEAKVLCLQKFENHPEYHALQEDRDEWESDESSSRHSNAGGTVSVSRPYKRALPTDSLSQERSGKTPRMGNATQTYAEKTKAIRVGIKSLSGTLSPAQCSEIEGEILRLVDLEEEGEGPSFQGSYPRAGIYIVQCADEYSRDWLIAHADQMEPWEGASLMAIMEEELPRPWLAVAWIPNGQLDKETILQRMRTQNRQIDLSHWRVVATRPEKKGQTVTFSFDESSCEPLSKIGNRLYLGMTVIQLRLKSPHKARTAVNRDKCLVKTGPSLQGANVPGARSEESSPRSSLCAEFEAGDLEIPSTSQTTGQAGYSDALRQAWSLPGASNSVSRDTGSANAYVPAPGRGDRPVRRGRGRNASARGSSGHAKRQERGVMSATARKPAQLRTSARRID